MTILCQKHKVEELCLFGSALTDQFHDNSDLDFLVTFGGVPPADYADNFFDFHEALGQLFARRIDLMESQTAQNPYFRQIVESTKMQVYARRPGAQMAA